jgi:hypothetical protein
LYVHDVVGSASLNWDALKKAAEEGNDAIVAFVVHALYGERGESPSSFHTEQVTKIMTSWRELTAAELAFYYANDEPVLPYFGPDGKAAILLVLSTEEAESQGKDSRPPVRTFFGDVAREIIIEGDHFSVGSGCCMAQYRQFNKGLEDFLGAPDGSLTGMAEATEAEASEEALDDDGGSDTPSEDSEVW